MAPSHVTVERQKDGQEDSRLTVRVKDIQQRVVHGTIVNGGRGIMIVTMIVLEKTGAQTCRFIDRRQINGATDREQ